MKYLTLTVVTAYPCLVSPVIILHRVTEIPGRNEAYVFPISDFTHWLTERQTVPAIRYVAQSDNFQ